MTVKSSVKKQAKKPESKKSGAELHDKNCPLHDQKLHDAGKVLLAAVLENVKKQLPEGKEAEKFTVKMGAMFKGGHYLVTVQKMSFGEMLLKGIADAGNHFNH